MQLLGAKNLLARPDVEADFHYSLYKLSEALEATLPLAQNFGVL